jgi:Family of unknown function (DUF6338)
MSYYSRVKACHRGVVTAADVLSFFTSETSALKFFALLFPGFVAISVYDLRVPGERRKFADLGIALVAYSVIIDAFATLLVVWIPVASVNFVGKVLLGVLFDVVVPISVGWFILPLRETLARRGLALSAIPKAWDEFFGRLSKLPDDESVALVLTLSNGTKIGGFWAESPFASSFPADEDLFIPAPVTIDQASGRFMQRVESSKGLLVKRSDILIIEAFDGHAVARAAITPDSAEVIGEPQTEILKPRNSEEQDDGKK